jgi:uncharacterized membrane protein
VLLRRKRADLDLQISHLAEHEITRVLQLVARMDEKLGLEEASAAELAELKRDVAPEKVLEKIEKESISELPRYCQKLCIGDRRILAKLTG